MMRSTLSFWSLLSLVMSSWMIKVIKSESNDDRDWFLCPFNGDACYDYDCSLNDGHIRGGYVCESFPWYSGGVGPSRYKKERKERQCIDGASTNYTYCNVWYAIDYKEDKTESGYCQCAKKANNGPYCSIWLCWQEDVDTNDNTNIYDDYNELTVTECEGDNKNDLNFTLYCPDSSLTLEIIQCWCYVSGGNNEYCLQYYCEERDYNNYDYSDVLKYSYHLCTSFFPSDDDTQYATNYNYFNKFCWQWRGDKVSDERFEVSDCWCSLPNNYTNYCEEWVCEEKEMPYYYGNSLFLFGIIFFNILIFIFNLLPLCIERIDTKNKFYVFLWFFIGFICINIGVWLCCGLIGEIFYLPIWYLSWHIIFIYMPYKTCNSYRIVCCHIAFCDNLCCLWDKIDNIIHINMIDGVLANDVVVGGNNNIGGGNGAGIGPGVQHRASSIGKDFISSRKDFTLSQLRNANAFDDIDSITKSMFISEMRKNSNISEKELKMIQKSTITVENNLYFTFQQQTTDNFMVDIKFKIKDYGSIFPFEGQSNTEFNIPTFEFLLNDNKNHFKSNNINWNIRNVLLFLNQEFNAVTTLVRNTNQINANTTDEGTEAQGQRIVENENKNGNGEIELQHGYRE